MTSLQQRSAHHPARALPRIFGDLRGTSTLVTWGLLIVAVVLAAILQPKFFTLYSITSNFATFTPLVFAAVAQAVVILSGGLDLSVGAVIALSSVTALTVMNGDDTKIALGFIVAILTGIGCGIVNGIIIGVVRLQPLIATFGTLSIFSGITLLVLPQPGGAVPPALTSVYRMAIGRLPISLLLVLSCALLWWILSKTVFARHVYAVGSNAESAYASLVPVTGVKIGAYATCGFFAGLAALAILSNTGSGDPFIGESMAMDSIAACVLGGIALSGGRGSGYGAIAGALILSLTSNILFFIGVPTTYRQLASGLVIIAALALSVLSPKGGKTQ
ncbi:ABC transporter permease [Schaalia sp. ZJ405]|uniref:ABC transporter permease n=1 Tax=Schaalia sp. ZJ405 TaxID=2709403 RepID=UPI0013EA5CD8|nr:ABC transporter permease [Schaalia sp. ZJ405]QPK80661.1 ABC transporter permease [Schaalia sp. ZJ405]